MTVTRTRIAEIFILLRTKLLTDMCLSFGKPNYGLCINLLKLGEQELHSAEHRACKLYLHANLPGNAGLYAWPPTDKNSRIEWLDIHIKKLQDEFAQKSTSTTSRLS